MSHQQASVALAGGLDLSSAPLFVRPGMSLFMQNYVCDLNGGYRRIRGYERYDGQPAPSELGNRAGRDARRAAIAPVPGAGPVRGVAMLKGVLYAWRDNPGATACLMWKATGAGWVPVSLGTYLPYEAGAHAQPIAEGDTITNGSGASAIVRRLVISSGSFAGAPAATGRLVVDTVVGGWAAGNSIQVGGQTKAKATGSVTPHSQAAGGDYRTICHNFYGSSDRLRLYGVDGAGPAFEFDGTVFCQLKTAMPLDKPTALCVHQGYLFLAFAGGSLQNSGIGEPATFSPRLGAGEIGTGDVITDLVSTRDVLATYGRTSLHLLYGAQPNEWALKSFSSHGGCKPKTAKDIGGDVLAYDEAGLGFLQAVQAFGDFKASQASSRIEPLLAGQPSNFALMSKALGRYQLFLADRSCIVATLLGTEIRGFGRCQYAHTFVCGVVGADLAGTERQFVGGLDGYVYELERGTSFDGLPMEFILRLPYVSHGGGGVRKRYHRIQLEVSATSPFTLLLQPDYDYGTQRVSTYSLQTSGAGGFWDVANWDEFVWDEGIVATPNAYLEGVASNVGFLIYGKSDEVDTFNIAAMHVYYSIRGQSRG